MPADYHFDDRIIVVRGHAKYTTEELRTAVLGALADPERPVNAVLMLDLRTSNAVRTRTSAQVRDMADFLSREAAGFGSRLGMVTSTDVQFGLMRLGAAYAENEGVDAAVFRDYDEARAWLLR